jgi:hypothetical protein
MLELRPNCECCNKDLPPHAPEAMICSFECTFCVTGSRRGWGDAVRTVAAGLSRARLGRQKNWSDFRRPTCACSSRRAALRRPPRVSVRKTNTRPAAVRA